MGETLAANCVESTVWLSAGRSDETRARAESHGMAEAQSLGELVERCSTIVSICPPGAAIDVATQVAGAGFEGIYVDANAISPDTARSLATMFDHYVDASVIGPPAHSAGTTRLYLSGVRASEIKALYKDGVLDARIIDDSPSAASALKMAYASWTKIGSALHMAIRAFAAAEGVDDALVSEWDLSQPGMTD